MRAVNLLPPDTRGASKVSADLGAGPEAKGGAGPFVVLGVLAACVAGAAGYVLTENTVKQRTADLAEATAQQQAIARQAAELQPYADFDADGPGARRDRQGHRGLALRLGAGPARPLARHSRRRHAEVADRRHGQRRRRRRRRVEPLRGAINAPAITLQGCAPGQTEVSRLLARLHDVQGVTRVTLSKSTKPKIETQRRCLGQHGPAAQRDAVRHGQASRRSSS